MTTSTQKFGNSLLKKRGGFFTRSLVSAIALAGCAVLTSSVALAKDVAGYLYTSLNGEGTNAVVSVERYSDGTLGAQRAYSTGAKGGANRAAGGDAFGDFDSQGAIRIIDNSLLVVNAGGNSISVFALNRKDGTLAHQSNVDSMGIRPVSIASMKKPGSESDYWVVVGNQWNNPNAQKGGDGEGALEIYPNPGFVADGGAHEAVLTERNIYLFSFNSKTGSLTAEKLLDSYNGTNGGPTTVEFNHDGSKLAVATWGIAHFATQTPTQQKPSRVYVYDFDKSNGNVAGRRYFEEHGVAGSIGFSWDKRNSTLFVSNFNLVPEKRDHSLTVLTDNGEQVTKAAYFGTGNGADIDEACWTTTNASGDKLYVSSFGGNFISVFDVGQDGSVSKIGNGPETVFTARKEGTPPGDTKDMYVTPDGKHLYNLGAYQTFTIATFDLDRDGIPQLSEEYKIEAATAEGPGAYNFLGLAGIEKS